MSESIVITGATGVIGRRAVAELVRAGHLVSAVTRSARGRATLERLRASAVEADVLDERDLAAAFVGATVVVNLLTHIPAAERHSSPRTTPTTRSTATRWFCASASSWAPTAR